VPFWESRLIENVHIVLLLLLVIHATIAVTQGLSNIHLASRPLIPKSRVPNQRVFSEISPSPQQLKRTTGTHQSS
jgi:hypothetical protein